MKRLAAIIMAIACLLALSGCGQGANKYGPFKLTVTCGEASTEAKIGTHSWSSPKYSVDACGTGLPGGRDSMNCLGIAGAEQLTAQLDFEVIPDSVTVLCWSGDYWEKGGTEVLSVNVPVTKAADGYSFSLKDGVYIYRVSAKWEHTGKYGGTVDYSFYTE